MFCRECGNKIDNGATFCQSCGSRAPVHVAGDTKKVRPVAQPYFRYIAVAGGALVIIGSFLPWIKVYTIVGTLSTNGIEYGWEGFGTLICGGLIAMGALIDMRPPKNLSVVVCLFSALVLIIGFVDLKYISDSIHNADSEFSTGSVGEGIYLVILGGILGLAGLLSEVPKGGILGAIFGRRKPVP